MFYSKFNLITKIVHARKITKFYDIYDRILKLMDTNYFDQTILFLLALFGGATIITTTFRYLKLPTQIGFILSGVALGPFGFKLLEEGSYTQGLAEIAAVLLMFCLGLEFSFSKLKALRKELLVLGPLQLGGTTLVVFLISYFFMSQKFENAILWGLFISLSSTALIFKQLKESKKNKTQYGTTSISILLFQDLAVIPVILVINYLASAKTGGSLELNYQNLLLNNFILFTSIYFLKKWLIPFSLEKIAKTQSKELFYYAILLLCFGISYLSHGLGLSYSIGAFIAGLTIADSPYGRHALSEFSTMRDNFLGIFFMTIGILINPYFIFNNFPRIFLYVILIIIIKVLVIYTIMRLTRNHKNISIIVSIILAQVGEFSFILATLAFQKNIISLDDLQLFISLSVSTLILTPILFKNITFALKIFGTKKEKQRLISFDAVPEKETYKDMILVVGFGHMGQEIVREIQAINTPYKIIEQNYDTYSKHKKNYAIHYGDASRHEQIETLDLDQVKLAIICINHYEIISTIIENLRTINPLLKICIRLEYIIDESEFSNDENIIIVTSEREVTKNMISKLRDHFLE